MKSRILYLIIGLLSFFGLFTYLVNQSNSTYNPHVPGDYHSSLFADAAGYHVYLPGVFNSWFFGKVPEKADSIAGNGFVITSDKKIKTKYPYGTALLQAPIYLIGKVYASQIGEPYEGNSILNHKYADYSGIFYGVLAIFLLFIYLKSRTNAFTAAIIALALLFGTNIYYYTIKASSYSHIYSFFLFVVILLVARFYFNKPSIQKFILLGSCVLIIYLVRPFNILVVPLLLFIESNSFNDVKNKFLQLLTIKNCLVFILLALLFILPQLIYWKWAFGSYLPDTYPGEKFSNLLNPQIIPFLFAPHNGLFPYSPIFALLFIFLFIYPFIKKWEGVSILIFILVMTYLSTAWYTYAMGCGFGARNYVEYSAILSIPAALIIHNQLKHWIMKLLLIGVLIYPISVNITLTNNFDMCFFGKGDWDWKEYKYMYYQKLIKIKTDPDSSLQFINNQKIITDFTRPNNSCFSAEQKEFVCTLNIPFSQLNKVPTVMCTVSADINNVDQVADFELVIQIIRNGQQIYYNGNPIKNETKGWYSIYHVAYFPKDLLLSDELRIFILNKNKSNFLVDNIELITR